MAQFHHQFGRNARTRMLNALNNCRQLLTTKINASTESTLRQKCKDVDRLVFVYNSARHLEHLDLPRISDFDNGSEIETIVDCYIESVVDFLDDKWKWDRYSCLEFIQETLA